MDSTGRGLRDRRIPEYLMIGSADGSAPHWHGFLGLVPEYARDGAGGTSDTLRARLTCRSATREALACTFRAVSLLRT